MGEKTFVYGADGALLSLTDDRTVAQARAEASDRIRWHFSQAVAQGMPWRNKTLQIDDASRAHLDAACLRAQRGTLPAGFAWRMADNTTLPLDAPGMIAMAEAAMDFYLALRQRLWTAAEKAAAAPDNNAADAVTF